jgi:hypothetical protein
MSTIFLVILLGAGIHVCLIILSALLRPLWAYCHPAVGMIATWAFVVNTTWLFSYFSWSFRILLISTVFAVIVGIALSQATFWKSLKLYSVYSLPGLWGIIILSLPLVLLYPSDAVITEFGVNNDSVHHAFLGRGYGSATGIIPALKSYPQGTHAIIWLIAWLLQMEPVFLVLPVTIVGTALVGIAFTQAEEYGHVSSLVVFMCSLGVAFCFLSMASCYFVFSAQSFVLPFATMLSLMSIRSAGNIRVDLPLVVIVIATINTYSIMGLSLMAIIIIVNYRAWYDAIAKFIKNTRCKLSPWIGWKLVVQSIILTISLLSVFPNLQTLVMKFLPYFVGYNPLGENLWAASGVLPQYIDVLHLSGIWPFAGDFRFFVPDGNLRVKISLFLVLVGALLNTRLSNYKILYISVGIIVLAISFSGTYLYFKVVAMVAPLILFGIYYHIALLLKNNRMVLQLAVLMLCLALNGYSYYLGVPSLHAANVVTKEQVEDLMLLKSTYVDKFNVLVLDKMEFASYIIDDLQDFSPLTNYLYRPWSGQEVDYIIVSRKDRSQAREYLVNTAGISLSRTRMLKRLKGWDVYRF